VKILQQTVLFDQDPEAVNLLNDLKELKREPRVMDLLYANQEERNRLFE
jgi:metal-dependent hydrolase (beta-lactamase superfamily II)